MSAHKAIILVGPTAVGKTELSLQLAEQLGGEVVSSDSRQVYRYMSIGTAKPTRDELLRVPHHFIDIRDPNQFYSAGEYGREARACVRELFERNTVPIVTGGSGFYIQALVDGLFAPQMSDPDVKEKWRQRIREQGQEAVLEALRKVDPKSAERLHPNDMQRVVRALEIYDLTGKPISEYRKGDEKPCEFEPVFIGLQRDRKLLYDRINLRVDLMIQEGLLDEVRDLEKKGWGPELNALKTVGYQEVYDHFDGKLEFDEMIRLIKRNSRRYAKRQLTWFRKDQRIHWLDLEQLDVNSALENILEIWDAS